MAIEDMTRWPYRMRTLLTSSVCFIHTVASFCFQTRVVPTCKKEKMGWIQRRWVSIGEAKKRKCTAPHLIGQEQSMQFSENDHGPFYLTPGERIQNKNQVPAWQQVTWQKTKPELMRDLNWAGFNIKGRYTMNELRQHSRRFDVPLTIDEEVIQPGWVSQNKGLLHVLWERGWIDERNVQNIS